jgi:WD repeat-containing protein 68
MSGFVPTVLMCSSAVVLMEVCECSICGVWSTALLYTNLLPRMTKVCFVSSSDSVHTHNFTDASPGGRISPTLAQQTMSYAPPLLRLAASPHDTHLLATFSQDSSIIRILDVRQPGQALLELRGHGSSINCIEWSPTRRGTLASGADDSLVLIWDLLSQSTAIAPPGPTMNGAPASDNTRGPAASWQCDYEVGNISWAPHSSLSNDGGDWVGVSGGRGIWGVKL